MSPRVLVVDDEPQILRALRTSLHGAGYEVETAETAEGALAALAAHPPDAVVLDLVLPDGSGTAVCRELRRWSSAPVIVLSVIGDEAEKVAALDAGADDYVTKPFGIDELLARLRAALRRADAPAEPVVECSLAIPGSCLRTGCCCARCGGGATATSRTTFTSTSRSSGGSSSPIRRGPASSSRSPAPGTGSRHRLEQFLRPFRRILTSG
jgi:DNA-binding response OmpR family regulator